jgi:3-oxoacyl-[acyl-carrier protein] reductase
MSEMGERVMGKNAVVTGSSHGVGRAVAMALAAEGANVVVNGSGAGPEGLGTELGPLNETVDQIVSRGGVAIASCGSVADFTYAGRLIATCVDNFGSVDILVNCAGIPEVGSIVDVPPETWHRVVDVHLNGTFNCCRHAAPLMVQQRRGRIINTASHAFLGIYGGTAYAAAKGGIISLTRAMARDLSEHGVTCNVFCPGAKTRLSSGEAYEEKMRLLFAKGWLNEAQRDGGLHPPPPESVTPLVLYLATDEAAKISGHVFVVTGGYVGLFPEPKEERLAWKDYRKNGPWTVDELATLLPAQLGLDSVKLGDHHRG